MADATRPRVAICVCSMEHVHADFAHDLALLLPMAMEVANLDLLWLQSSMLVHSREQTVTEALALDGMTHVLFLDSDMRFPPYLLHKLLAAQKDVVGCNYPRRKHPYSPTAIHIDGDAGLFTLDESVGLERVSALGAGCLLVSRKAILSVNPPRFMMPWSRLGGHAGEDMYFCKMLRDAGVDLYVDHTLSHDIRHIGSVELSTSHSVKAGIARGSLPPAKPKLILEA